MPFKKPNVKKNKTKKQKKPVEKSARKTDDGSSVEELEEISVPPTIPELPLEETEPTLSQEEIEMLEEYMWQNYYLPDLKLQRDALISDLEDPDYWEQRLAFWEDQRCRYTKKAAWSAKICQEIDHIDANIKICQKELDRIYGEEKEEPIHNSVLGYDWWKTDENGWATA